MSLRDASNNDVSYLTSAIIELEEAAAMHKESAGKQAAEAQRYDFLAAGLRMLRDRIAKQYEIPIPKKPSKQDGGTQ